MFANINMVSYMRFAVPNYPPTGRIPDTRPGPMAFGYTISHNKLGWINVGKVDEVSINLDCELVAIHLVQH